MPVEVRELIIKASIGEKGDERETPPAGLDREKIIEECVEQAMRILREKEER